MARWLATAIGFFVVDDAEAFDGDTPPIDAFAQRIWLEQCAKMFVVQCFLIEAYKEISHLVNRTNLSSE